MIHHNLQSEAKFIVVEPGETLEQITEQMCLLALERTDWCVTKAAHQVGLCRTTLAMKLKAWGFTRIGNRGVYERALPPEDKTASVS